MSRDANYLKQKKELVRELFKIEDERKKINARWRDATQRAKALDRYLIDEDDES